MPSSKKLPTWTVGRIAARCGVKVSTMHFYEEKGLIFSWRNNGNQRRYFPDVIRRVSLIKAAQKMGIALGEIKHALDKLPDRRTPTKNDWEKMASVWRDQLNARIRFLEHMRDNVTGCIGCGCLSMDRCPIYNPDDILYEECCGPVLLDRTLEQAETKVEKG